MKGLVGTLILLVGCAGEGDQAQTATIAPAPARPSVSTAVAAMEDTRIITTGGSPSPNRDAIASLEPLHLTDAGIRVRPALPQMHTAFRVRNDGKTPHALRLTGSNGTQQSLGALNPGQDFILQLELARGSYTLTCTVPGHAERAQFETYPPGITRPQ